MRFRAVPNGVLRFPHSSGYCADRWSLYLRLDRERMRRWGIDQAVAWGVSGGKLEDDMIECARLLLAARS
jgi:hypothetical protein